MKNQKLASFLNLTHGH